MLYQVVMENIGLFSVLFVAALAADIFYMIFRKGAGRAAVACMAAVCAFLGVGLAGYGIISAEAFNWITALCIVCYVVNRQRPVCRA